MSTIRIERGHKKLLVELASRISIAKSSYCSMTEALDLLLDHLERHFSSGQLADRLLMDEQPAGVDPGCPEPGC